MSYQFASFFTYSRSGGKKGDFKVAGCLGEAFRDDGFCDHVTTPDKNVSFAFGSRESIENAIKNYEDNFKDSRGHKLRKDGKILIAGVFSYPPGTTEEDFLVKNEYLTKWLKKEYGDGLRCVLSHKDEPFKKGDWEGETHYHSHFFVVPEISENIDKYHCGIKAKKEARAAGKNKLGENIAYKWAMGDWQDKVNKELGSFFGFEKSRPPELKEKRLSRKEYKILAAAEERLQEAEVKNEWLLNKRIQLENREKEVDNKLEDWEKAVAKQSVYLQEKEEALQKREKEVSDFYRRPEVSIIKKALDDLKNIIPEVKQKVFEAFPVAFQQLIAEMAKKYREEKGFKMQQTDKGSKDIG